MRCDICKKYKNCMWRHNADATLSVKEKLVVTCARYVEDKELKLQSEIEGKKW